MVTIKTCEYEQHRCLSIIRWSTTPYWSQVRMNWFFGYYVKTVETSAGSILIEIEESTILAQFFRIEIVKKSTFEYLPKSAKIEIE